VKVLMTIVYLEPFPDGTPVPPIVLEFDHFTLEQSRPVHRQFGAGEAAAKLIPDPTTTTTIVGTKTVLSDFQGCHGCGTCECEKSAP
jgi:NAD-dependent dihydropyrimidine dehydrogenase PreA subunit